MQIIKTISSFIIGLGMVLSSIFSPHSQPKFGTNVTQLPNVLANFSDSLASPIGSSDTSMTLVSGQDTLSRSISGFYCFTIDAQTSISEFVCGTASGTSVTSMTRGIDPLNPNATSASLQFTHRRGASVQITDYTSLGAITRMLAGTDTLPAVLQYPSGTSDASISGNNQNLVNVSLLNNTAIAGAANASTTVKGIVQESTQAQVLSKTAAGSTGARLYVNPSTLASTLSSDYVADTGSANTYLIAPSPAITAYTVGQVFTFKATNANTIASTLNVNSLGGKSLTKETTSGATALVANDIVAGQVVTAEYDGTQFQMLNPVANIPVDTANNQSVGGLKTFTTLPQSAATPSSSSDLTTKTYVDSAIPLVTSTNGNFQRGANTAGTSQTVAHGLGRTPRKVTMYMSTAMTTSDLGHSIGVYNGSTTSTVYDEFIATNASTGRSTSKIVVLDRGGSLYTASITVDATNINLTWDAAFGTNYGVDISWVAE